MSEKSQGKTTRRSRQSLLGWLLSFWSEYRRFILVALILLALYSFLSSMELQTRRSLVTGLLAQRQLVMLLLVFSLVTLSLLFSAGQRLDTWIFLLLNLRGYHPLWLDRVMWAFTQVGNGVVGLLLCIVLYFIDHRRLAVEMLFGILTLWLAVELVKAIVERSRPFLALEGTRVIGWRERGLSFPSGHTAQAFFMMTVLNQYFSYNVVLASILYGLAVLVAFTRIYVGAHYPRDVIAGGVLGTVWGILTGLIEVYLSTGQF